jgi:uracil-DNA glycosylase
MSDGATQTEIEWAHHYDGYGRLANTPTKLGRLLQPARNSFQSHGRVPEWCGVDFLRGWAFYLVRADRHMGGGALGEEWVAVLDALRGHPEAALDDRPPRLPRQEPLDVGFATAFSDRPKMHKEAAFLAAKQARLRAAHVAPINDFVDEIAHERGAHVPYVDPDSGGIHARVLFVLESPAGPAALGSGMLSADNDDETAKNVWKAYQDSDLPRGYGLHWNAVPWYLGDAKKNKTPSAADVELGRQYLLRLIHLAPGIRVVLAMGKKAQKSVAGASDALLDRDILVIECPHPGPIPAGVTAGKSLIRVLEAFKAARAVAYSDETTRGKTDV